MTERAWWVMLAIIALLVGAALLAQPRTVTLAIGRFGATDSEIAECYFNVGFGASLALHPTGVFCPIARELVGRTGTLVFIPD